MQQLLWWYGLQPSQSATTKVIWKVLSFFKWNSAFGHNTDTSSEQMNELSIKCLKYEKDLPIGT